ncbi:CASP-like protein 2C1 [Olea europaea var. sylvestris]|uniref:CASP-like protein 2C1 n=1 Tax=Olea europaea var. sylvestris TaxID=158386 RepID=UPI000C1D43EE|nr:CASP-like protein 2C1 [Olea europaea var. sylvestris]
MGVIGRKEAFLRVLSTVFLVLTVCLVAFDAQTKLLFYSVVRKATFRDLNALFVLVWIDSAAAVCNLLQLFRGYILPGSKEDLTSNYRYLAWGFCLLDQAAAYIVFAANSAAAQASMLAVTGESSFQWMKVCNRFTRFCIQIVGALLCAYCASIFMAVISSISAYNLFRFYSPKKFLLLKGK